MKKHYSFLQEAELPDLNSVKDFLGTLKDSLPKDKKDYESFLGLKYGYNDLAKAKTGLQVGKRMLDATERVTGDNITDYGFEKAVQNAPKWANDTKQKILKINSILNNVGGIGGAIGGGVAGNILSRKLFKVKQRNQIKQVILSSNTPNDCIEKLKQLGTPLALSYCNTVNKVYQKYPNDWKRRISNSINIKNATVQTVGTIGGTYAGNRLGYYAGNKLGQHMTDMYTDKLINKIHTTARDPGPTLMAKIQ
jgi:outer membrane lipoprotein SlyB